MGCLIVDKREGRNTAELIQALFAVVAVNSGKCFTWKQFKRCVNPDQSVRQCCTKWNCFEGLSLVAHRSYLKPS